MNVRKFPLKQVLGIFDLAYFHRPASIGKRYVTPGEKFGAQVSGQFESSTVADNNVPLKIETLWFYVPHRLHTPEFCDVIADPDSASTIPPVGGSGFPPMGEGTKAVTRNALGRRAYKTAFNRYLGDENFPDGWYTQIVNDAEITEKRVKGMNGLYLSSQLTSDDLPASMYTVDVAGPPAQIDMIKFDRATGVAKRLANERNTGTTYADALRRFGVTPPPELIAEPQLLNMTSEIVYPMIMDIESISIGDVGKRYGKYRFAVKSGFAPRFFMEHGMVFGVIIMRPLTPVHPAARQDIGYPADTLVLREEFLMEKEDELYERVNSFGLGEVVRPRGAFFTKGDLFSNNNANAYGPSATPTTFDETLYPQFSIATKYGISCVFDGTTPWPDRVLIENANR